MDGLVNVNGKSKQLLYIKFGAGAISRSGSGSTMNDDALCNLRLYATLITMLPII
jgi:hypothetical protein